MSSCNCDILCNVWLISPGGLFFFEGKWTRIWGRREVGWVGRSEAKENCSSDVICERGIIFFFKKKKCDPFDISPKSL